MTPRLLPSETGEKKMSKRKTHFEQVPLEVVKKIVEEEPQQQVTKQLNLKPNRIMQR
jgi:hypothetical protein